LRTFIEARKGGNLKQTFAAEVTEAAGVSRIQIGDLRSQKGKETGADLTENKGKCFCIWASCPCQLEMLRWRLRTERRIGGLIEVRMTGRGGGYLEPVMLRNAKSADANPVRDDLVEDGNRPSLRDLVIIFRQGLLKQVILTGLSI
jgi:hypothetical protein